MNTKVKILVLSGGNFVSQRIYEALQDSNWAAPLYGSVLGEKVPAFIGKAGINIEDKPASLHLLLDQVDAVVNCTGSPGSRMVWIAQAIQSYTTRRPIKVVHLSSISSYGGIEGNVDERAPLVHGIDDYSDCKAKTDEIISGIPHAVVLREGLVYGPGSEYWGGLIGRLLISGRLGKLGVNGDGVCNLVYIDDVIQAVIEGLKSNNINANIFNLVAPNPPTWDDFFARYAQALGCKNIENITAAKIFMESRIFSIALIVATKILAKLNVTGFCLPDPIRASLIKSSRQKITVDSSKICTEYHVNWMELDRGLLQMALWFKGHAKN